MSDTIQQAECYSFHDTSILVIDGWTTSATQYIRVYTPSTERHSGTWDTNKFYVTPSVSTSEAFNSYEDYVRLEGLQIAQFLASQRVFRIVNISSSASDVRIDACIIKDSAAIGVLLQDGIIRVTNCVFYNVDKVATFTGATAPTVSILNCTIQATAYGIDTSGGGTVTVKNCYCKGGTDAYNGTMTRTACAHSSATSFAGSTASVAYSTANFVNVTSGSEDLHLVSGSALKDAGTDLSATFTTDIDGQTRPTGAGTWDIGADEIVTASTFTATAALTIGHATLAASATFTAPTYHGSAALSAAPATAAASATFAPGTKTATAALNAAPATTTIAATFAAPLFTATAGLTVAPAQLAAVAAFYFLFDQYGFRWRNDDGSESAATWAASGNTDLSRSKGLPARLRVGTNMHGDPASTALKLQYRKVGDTLWSDIA